MFFLYILQVLGCGKQEGLLCDAVATSTLPYVPDKPQAGRPLRQSIPGMPDIFVKELSADTPPEHVWPY